MNYNPGFLILSLLLLQSCSSAKPSHHQPVEIITEAPTRTDRYLDGIYWPQALACGRAYTYWSFMCRPEVRLKELVDKRKPNEFVFEITGLTIRLALPLTTWFPYAVQDKLRKHEYAHSEMCIQIYKDATPVALAIANSMIGKTVTSHANDQEEAMEAALREVKVDVSAAYRKQIADKADAEGVIFDRITNHGMNNVLEADAIRQTQEEFAKHPVVGD